VKSPVASLCLICSSVRNRVSVTMLVLTFSITGGVTSPFLLPLRAAILEGKKKREFGKMRDNEV